MVYNKCDKNLERSLGCVERCFFPETSDPLNYAKMKYVLKEMQLPIRQKN